MIQTCSDLWGWQEVVIPSSTGKGEYVVAFPPWDRTGQEAICDCPGYLFRAGCRHIAAAAKKLCDWDGSDPEQTDDQRICRVCPKCGGPTER